jgi:hypothetical protein
MIPMALEMATPGTRVFLPNQAGYYSATPHYKKWEAVRDFI